MLELCGVKTEAEGANYVSFRGPKGAPLPPPLQQLTLVEGAQRASAALPMPWLHRLRCLASLICPLGALPAQHAISRLRRGGWV